MKILISRAPSSLVRRRPVRKASYSAWLFYVGKDKMRDTSIMMPSLFSSMIPAPLAIELEAPSKKIVHMFDLVREDSTEVIFAIKSASTCSLDYFRLSFWMSNYDSSSDHLSILPAMSGWPRSCLLAGLFG